MTDPASWRLRAELPSGGVRPTAACLPWIRRRLACDLHARGYHDSGVEVWPGPYAEEAARSYRIGTPHCQEGDRPLGVLDPMGAWVARSAPARSWAEFRRRAFVELAVPTWATRRHLGCFHRRGKARHDHMFELAVVLHAGMRTPADGRFWTLGAGTQDGPYIRMLQNAGMPLPADKPGRHLAVECCGEPLAVLRSDGRAATTNGIIDLASRWWAGAGQGDLACAIRAQARHGD